MIIFFGTCLTCCIAGLPYISSDVFLPIFVFDRAYSLYFLRQFGDHYNLLMELPAPPPAAFPVIMASPPPPHPPADPPTPHRDV